MSDPRDAAGFSTRAPSAAVPYRFLLQDLRGFERKLTW